jgi:hypothetical protein
MMIAIKASTEAMTPKMMVPVESKLDSVKVEAMVVFKAGRDWTMIEVHYLSRGDEAAWQSPFCCACFVYAHFIENLVAPF